jgi:hypothetical protein
VSIPKENTLSEFDRDGEQTGSVLIPVVDLINSLK